MEEKETKVVSQTIPTGIDGLTLISEVITKTQEMDLIQKIDQQGWGKQSLKRRVQQYGFRYDHLRRRVSEDSTTEDAVEPFPSFINELCQELLDRKLITDMPSQLIVNEYVKGQGISKHTDSKQFDNVIFSISLGSPCLMIFRYQSTNDEKEKDPREFVVEPRMFMKMQDEARHKWTHEIPPLGGKIKGKSLSELGDRRLSLTFRTFIPKEKK